MLTGSDFTQMFFGKSKINNLKKLSSKAESMDLISSINTDHVDIEKLRYFVLHVICKRPRREKSPGNSCYAMLYVGKGGGKKLAATKSLLPDQKSLTTKIL